jgi:cephalosporin-C deacetylase
MPLAKLKVYKPTLTRRKDFGAFWKDTLDAAHRQPLEADLRAQDYPATGVRVSRASWGGFGAGGGRISGWLLEPDSPGRHPAIIVYHGYSGRSPALFNLLAWPLQGFVVLTVDCRGQNGGSVDGAVYPDGHRPGFMTQGILDPQTYYYRYVYADCVRALEVAAARPSVDAWRMGVMGTSQGGGLSLAAAALAPKRVRVAAACVPFLCHYARAVDMAEYPYREIADYIKAWPQRADDVFRTLSYFDNLNLADRIRARTLVSIGLWDLICPPSTIFAAVNRLKCRKEMAVYPCTGHEENDDWRERVFSLMTEGLRK